MEESECALLAALQAHGQNFLNSFGPLPSFGSEPEEKRRKLECSNQQPSKQGDTSNIDNTDEVEWHGFDSDSDASIDDSSFESGDEDSIGIPNKRQPEVVVFPSFAQSSQNRWNSLSKSFMSSRVSKLRQPTPLEQSHEDSESSEDREQQRTDHQNDKLLHKLVHTQLLSGSLNPDLNLKPAQRRKAFEGRLLELAAGAKLGQGEPTVRREEVKKASKRVRTGLERKLQERKERTLEEAKNLGNYHRSMKHLYGEASKGVGDRRKRLRGLKLGVGKFSNGVLKLSREEIASGQGAAKHGRSRDKVRKGRR